MLSRIKNTNNEKYQRRWAEYVTSVAKYDSDKQVRAQAFDALGKWKVKSAKSLMVHAVGYSSYAIAGAALEALSKIDKDTAYILAKKYVSTSPQANFKRAIWAIICKKGADGDIALIEKYAPYIFSRDKIPFALSLDHYLKNVKSNASFSRCAQVYATLIVNDEMQSYRQMLTGFFFQVASDLQDDAKSDDKEKAASAQKRLDLLKPALQRITAAESDPELLKSDKKKMKDIFG